MLSGRAASKRRIDAAGLESQVTSNNPQRPRTLQHSNQANASAQTHGLGLGECLRGSGD